MSEQLDVFLGPQTAPFLVRLFEVIESQEYAKEQTIDESQNTAQIISETNSTAAAIPVNAAVSSQSSADSVKPVQLDFGSTVLETNSSPPTAVSVPTSLPTLSSTRMLI